MKRSSLLLGSLPSLMLAFTASCATPASRPASPYRAQASSERRSTEAERLTRQAAALVGTDDAAAEALLCEALALDLYHGPAHNNLGVIFLKRGQHYEAAAEFEWAKKLLPGHPDPRMNLALVLDLAGRYEDAIAGYASALEVFPGYVPALQGLARATVRSGRDDPKLPAWLATIALQGESESWKAWARAQSLARDR